jgi:uncharacterized membrane protein YiaA
MQLRISVIMDVKKSQIALVTAFVCFGVGIVLFVIGMGTADNKSVVGAGAAVLILSVFAFLATLMFKTRENAKDAKEKEKK